MENLDRRSGVIPFVEAQKRIPSAESDHAVTLLERGTVKIKLSLPVRPTVPPTGVLHRNENQPACCGLIRCFSSTNALGQEHRALFSEGAAYVPGTVVD